MPPPSPTTDTLQQVNGRIPYRHYKDLKDEVHSLKFERADIRQEHVIGAAIMAFLNMRETEKIKWVNCYLRELIR